MRTSTLPRILAAASIGPALAIAWTACSPEGDAVDVAPDDRSFTADLPVETASEIATVGPADLAPSGAPCADLDECPADEQCQGPAGCDAEWSCGPLLRCTRDLVTFCGCDGRT